MKVFILGAVFFFSGIILYVGVHILAAMYVKEMTGWSTPPGRFGTALAETAGNAPHAFSIWLCIIALILLCWEVVYRIIKPIVLNIKQNNLEYKASHNSHTENKDV